MKQVLRNQKVYQTLMYAQKKIWKKNYNWISIRSSFQLNQYSIVVSIKSAFDYRLIKSVFDYRFELNSLGVFEITE